MDVIGGLLRSSLLTELGQDVDRVGRVRGAAKELAAEFAGKSRALVPYAVVAAIDESTSATAAPLAEAERVLLDQWETFRNAFPEQPTEILRAVALASVVEAANSDEPLRQAAWYTLRTAIERLPAGRWAAPVTDLAKSWEGAIRSSIAAVWSPPTFSSKLRMPAIPIFDDKRIPINTKLRDRAKELGGQANYNVFAQQLQSEFGQHIDQIIGVSEALAAEAHKRSVAQLKDFATGLGAKLREALAAQDQTIEASRLRSELLWWRQTTFSPRLSRAYTDLDPADVAIAAAVDLHEIVPPIAPIAVEHLLADLVHHATGTINITIEALTTAEQALALPAATANTPAVLIDAVRSGTETPVMPPDQALAAGRASILIFRDLQARRLAATNPPEQSDEGE